MRNENFSFQKYESIIKFFIIFIEKLIHVFLETTIILKLGTIQSIISESIARFIPMIYFKLNGNAQEKGYNMISFSISLISSMIYLEIIQLNFYGLNKNTKKEIEIRCLRRDSDYEVLEKNNDSK